jgi:hypothetical protein
MRLTTSLLTTPLFATPLLAVLGQQQRAAHSHKKYCSSEYSSRLHGKTSSAIKDAVRLIGVTTGLALPN